mmetsp:Transcript_3182/g.6258  ORF Transcript_3182/g.6258 Transcript_3182/m.6258 type:complete len:438 (+) Transcript_3182:19-1332(+)|eukprot:CAMPEP_0167782464 /NCGR_PEP_ID=MMETSP0111_2-20121227/6533_1 /TAXON_ID=91324 /ORGANISM="Lotharella globosa, Strain CCCM811" /LENGTH=437 /DNA_ID=CAMNT_0007673301 /DNA_START=19 /DNA_END=1332 /DNA_ORIENTATION=-
MGLVGVKTLVLVLALPLAQGSDGPFDLNVALEGIANDMSKKYNCTIAFSARDPTEGEFASAIAGVSDFESGRPSKIDDRFVWGSVTKVFTGASILHLISQGVFGLDDKVASKVDPIIAKMAASDPSKGYKDSLAALYGPETSVITFRHLLSMQSGIPDFDTAKPDGKYPTDSFRATVYKEPHHVFSPMELMNLDWVSHGKLEYTPGTRFGYSSTNFMLLGLILANYYGYNSWEEYPQKDALPDDLKPMFENVTFALNDPPNDFTPMHGYDRTTYNNQTGGKDVWTTSGVFAGWTASNIVGSVGDIAKFTFELYGAGSQLISPKVQKEMIPEDGFYGLATMNFAGMTGPDKTGKDFAYGHLGATYGYDSVVGFFPALNMSLAVASSIESMDQAQPSDTLCRVYNTIYNHQKGLSQPTCEFVQKSYYQKACICNTTASA